MNDEMNKKEGFKEMDDETNALFLKKGDQRKFVSFIALMNEA